MSDILEKLVEKYVDGPMKPDIHRDDIPKIAKNIEDILAENDIFIGAVSSTGKFHRITLENGEEEAYIMPGPYSGDVTDIVNFCDTLRRMRESFPNCGYANNEIIEMMRHFEELLHVEIVASTDDLDKVKATFDSLQAKAEDYTFQRLGYKNPNRDVLNKITFSVEESPKTEKELKTIADSIRYCLVSVDGDLLSGEKIVPVREWSRDGENPVTVCMRPSDEELEATCDSLNKVFKKCNSVWKADLSHDPSSNDYYFSFDLQDSTVTKDEVCELPIEGSLGIYTLPALVSAVHREERAYDVDEEFEIYASSCGENGVPEKYEFLAELEQIKKDYKELEAVCTVTLNYVNGDKNAIEKYLKKQAKDSFENVQKSFDDAIENLLCSGLSQKDIEKIFKNGKKTIKEYFEKNEAVK